MKYTTRHKQSGDTIVEVLISIAIVSLVLAISYATANHSVRRIQDAQERSQALQLAQRQVEFIKAQNGLSGGACYLSSGTAGSGAGCSVDANGTPTTIEPRYNISVALAGGPGSAYKIQIKWASLIDNTQDNFLTLFYRP